MTRKFPYEWITLFDKAQTETVEMERTNLEYLYTRVMGQF